MIRQEVKAPKIQNDDELWGLDHGTWAVLKHLYPQADIPVLQLSIYMSQPGEYHLQIGQKLRSLRDKGILIIGSGNIVHNLRQIDFSPDAKLSIPTPDHWYPLLYVLGASDERDELRFEYEGIEHGSISMRCLSLGLG